MLVNQHYGADRDVILALADIFNAELREVAAAGCRVIQVEEPQHHIAGAAGAPHPGLQVFPQTGEPEDPGGGTHDSLPHLLGESEPQAPPLEPAALHPAA